MQPTLGDTHMSTKLFYPIILHPEDEGGYSVEIPDINGGAWTQGETVNEATEMAEDLICSMPMNQTEYPEATPLDSLVKDNTAIVVPLTIDPLDVATHRTKAEISNGNYDEFNNVRDLLDDLHSSD